MAALKDLAGHELETLLDGVQQTDAVIDRPSVIFAYTIKAWRLPTEGHPANHSALLDDEQWRSLAAQLDADADNPWARFAHGSAEAQLCARAAARLERDPVTPTAPPSVPATVGRQHAGAISTQQAFGRLFVDLARQAP